MAGIGFKLRQFVEEESFFGLFKGYFYSAVIAAGPWLITVFTLGLIALLAKGAHPLFMMTVTYTYCFSLIIVGLFQFVITRYLADRLYDGDIESHLPAYLGTLVLVLAPSFAASAVFVSFVDCSSAFRLQAVVFFQVVTALLVTMIFLGVVQAYGLVVWSFMGGNALGIALAVCLAPRWGDGGLLTGYMIGQLATLIVLILVLVSEFPMKKGIRFCFIEYFRRYPALGLIGLVYYLGLWADKFVMRAFKGLLIVPGVLYAAPAYEIAGFLAQLSIIPALAVFFLKVETEFFETYHTYYESISGRASLGAIKENRRKMKSSLLRGLWMLLRVQGAVTVCMILLAPQLFQAFIAEGYTVNLIRIGALGSFFQILAFFIVIVMMYYEFYAEALATSLVFLVTNALGAYLLIPLGPSWDGWCYVIAGVVSLATGAILLKRGLDMLEYITFTGQALPNLKPLEPSLVGPGGLGRFLDIPQAK